MKLILAPYRKLQKGHALVLTMIFTGISLLLLASTLGRTSSGVGVTDRNNSYNRAVAAAEAASEIVLARMDQDFLNQSIDYNNLDPYRRAVPSTYLPTGWAADYEFSDTNGAVNRTTIFSTGSSIVTNLDAPFAGLFGIVFPCRVIANARQLATPISMGKPYDVAAAVQVDFQLASIPVFQFMSFYTMDMEINPGALMKITGKVHGNADLYISPAVGLEFVDAVGAVGKINNNRMADDPLYGSAKVAPVYDSTHKEGDISLNLPIGTTNSPTEIIKILDPPPLGESITSPMGRQRYYNKADLIIITTLAGVAVKSGSWNSYSAIAPDAGPLYSFISATPTFTDQRENKPTLTTQIDVSALNKWLTNVTGGASVNNLAKFQNGHQINSIYVDDQRVDPAKLTVVRVVNGQQLPPDGLTVATDLPLYVKGHYNALDTTPGSTSTVNTKPASLVGDSVTVLSSHWVDTNSSGGLSSRLAVDTTVNAAFLAGIVQTTNIGGIKHYSGGLENFPRFLEDWGGHTFTYNGSMVVMFPSRFAKSFWPGTGTIYNPPVRKWAFDNNFLVQAKLPPCTPQVRKLLRGQWNAIAANAH